ncbi:copper-binding protein [Roseiarcaceae bacterium H3SJ34-1]|nr:copper-binding protein [Roseiarcaceae bacterium H3SJ34-1]
MAPMTERIQPRWVQMPITPLNRFAIPNLDIGEMTMVFKAGDPAMLKTVKAGDKVRFTADRVNGQLTVTKIEKTK